MAVGRAVGGAQPVHADEPARRGASMIAACCRASANSEERRTLARHPGGVQAADHDPQPLQQLVGSLTGFLASGAPC